MSNPEQKASKPRSFTADSPFSLIGIMIAALIGIILGGIIAMWMIK